MSSSWGFKNDNSSRRVAEQAQLEKEKLASEEAAKKAEEENIKAQLEELKKLRKTYNDLREDHQNLKSDSEKLKTQINNNNQDRGNLSNESEQLKIRLNSSNQDRENLKNENERLKTQINSNNQELEPLRQMERSNFVPGMNNLPLSYHDQTFSVINSHSRTAIDFGKAGSKCHAWHCDPRNTNQRLTLRKTDYRDPKSPWTIGCNGYYLAFVPSSPEPVIYSRASGSDGQNQEWHITAEPNLPGHYQLYNVGQKCWLNMQDYSRPFEAPLTLGKVATSESWWSTKFVFMNVKPY